MLMVAVRQGDLAMLSALLDKGADTEVHDCHGKTALMIAVQTNHMELTKMLLAKGADTSVVDDEGLTPLEIAMNRNDDPMIEVLLANGADPEVRDAQGLTALMRATVARDIEGVELLLHRGGADVHAVTEAGENRSALRLRTSVHRCHGHPGRPRGCHRAGAAAGGARGGGEADMNAKSALPSHMRGLRALVMKHRLEAKQLDAKHDKSEACVAKCVSGVYMPHPPRRWL